jgi:hypothetical protein
MLAHPDALRVAAILAAALFLLGLIFRMRRYARWEEQQRARCIRAIRADMDRALDSVGEMNFPQAIHPPEPDSMKVQIGGYGSLDLDHANPSSQPVWRRMASSRRITRNRT